MIDEANAPDNLFTYGLLMSGLIGHNQMKGSTFVGPATLEADLIMLDLGSYPGLVPAAVAGRAGVEQSSGTNRITGELYRVPRHMLATLDHFEQVPTLYQRQQLSVNVLPAGPTVKAWVYVYAKSIEQPQVVESGDWREHAGA